MPPCLFPTITGVVLDGGKASRLGGVHKAFLQVGGQPIAERTLGLFRELFGDLVTATSRPQPWAALGVRCVADSVADAGPLAGLAAGLVACRTPLAFVVAGDMPELSREVIVALCERAIASGTSKRCVIPRVDGRAEPLHAVYPAALGALALEALGRGRRKLTDFLEDVEAGGHARIQWVDFAELASLPGAGRTFRNLNTPGDLDSANGREPGSHGPA